MPGIRTYFSIKNLNPDSTYYFAIKVIDGSSNVSVLSNVVTGTTDIWYGKVKNTDTTKRYSKVTDAYSDTITQTGDVLLCEKTVLEENISFDKGKKIKITGGCNGKYVPENEITFIEGDAEVKSGEVIFSDGEVHFISESGEAVI